MIITDITRQRRKQNRYNLFSEDGFVMSLSDETIVKNGVKTGIDLSGEQLERLRMEDTLKYAKELAAAYVSRGLKTRREVMDYLKAELKDRHVRRLRKGKCTIELGFVLTDLITNYERVADHCSNIAVCLIQVVGNDGFDTHEYLDNVKSKDNEEFRIKVHWYKEKYELP